MGGALAAGIAEKIGGENIILCDTDIEKAENLAKKIGAVSGNLGRVCSESEFIFLAVKPYALGEVAEDCEKYLTARKNDFVIVSMLAGVEIFTLERTFDYIDSCSVIRIMPNVNCSVGAGVTLVSSNSYVTRERADDFSLIMSKTGIVDEIPEGLINAGMSLSGCGPAYVFMFIEALADGAVECGLPRGKAYDYAIATLIGSAKLMESSGLHPGQLKDMVCSPGGTTIEGVRALEKNSFRFAAMQSVIKAYKKTIKD